jgi:hypothetical protein
MANLTDNSGRKFHGNVVRMTYDVGPNLEVFAGQAMIAAANGIINATPTAAGDFLGFADEYVDNRDNVEPHLGANRATTATLVIDGLVWIDVANGAAFTYDDVGLQVYASDGNTFTTSAGTNNILIGKIVNVDAAVVSGGNTEEVCVRFGPST